MISLGVLAGAASLGVLIQRDPGYMLVAIGSVAIETSFWVALALFLVLLAVGHFLLRLSQGSLKSTSRFSRYLAQRREKRSHRESTDGLIALVEGNYQKARQLLTRHIDDLDEPLLNYLGAAYASNALGEVREANALLAKAERETQGARVAIELVQARLLLQNGRLEESHASLTRAQRNVAKHPAVLRLLKSVYEGLEDWESLLALLPDLKKNRLVQPEELTALQRKAALGQLLKLGESSKADGEQLRQCWQKLPKELRSDATVVEQYVNLLVEQNETGLAEETLRKHLRKDWRRELVALYGQIAAPEPDKQLLTAESWLPDRTNDATLLLALGRLSLRNELWGKAREYLESSHRFDPGPDVCAELGRLLAYLGEHERSSAFFQEGLQKSSRAIPMKFPTKVG
nr:heme biosynthesis HemY N-terminal domain-containing protein [Litorivivens lipolytica]